MKILSNIALVVLITLCSKSSFSQTININRSLWHAANESDFSAGAGERQIIPKSYRVLKLDLSTLWQQLLPAPKEMDVVNGIAAPLIMEFPNPAGGFSKYKVWYFSPMHPDLQAKYPEMRSYAGIGIDDPASHVFFDITPKGFHSMTLRSKGGSVFIDPYAKNDTEHYLVYYKRDFVKKLEDRMICEVDERLMPINDALPEGLLTANCGKRREYRLALACTGEYATFHGGTVPLALAAINTSMTRVNGVYVTEASILMNLIANNNLIVYLNPATDPYTNNNGSAMLTENQTTLTNVIGAANYDVGHVFSTGGGGVAVLNSPCSAANKAKGVTGGAAPVGDAFDIDYVAHEMGHQFGGAHTFSSSVGNCNGNGTASSAFEPGSGTTIMAYAGICGADDVQPHSDAYFHARSLLQMSNFVTPASHTCDNEITIGNIKPVVATMANVTYPKSTPFVLNGSATDPNGDPLTYCWEQYNNALVSPPAAGNTSGPLFRSLTAVSESYRYFPSFDNVFNNTVDPWEVLPGVPRTLTFKLTARDNIVAGGCTDEQNMNVVIAAATAGPFTVVKPNGGEILEVNSSATMTWNVAGTNANGINCANVDILYSITPSDPTSYIMLLASTPNDGTQAITVPNAISSTVRIMIRCASTNGTFFYDISNSNFNIIASPLPVELVTFAAHKQSAAVNLNWETSSENNNKGFFIERSTGASFTFSQLGFVPAVTEIKPRNTYSFTDKTVVAGNTYYYRLRQEDNDGKFSYSDLKTVSFESSTQLQITPNPARTAITMDIANADKDATYTVQVFSNDGRLVLSRIMPVLEAIDIHDWTDGVYFIQVKSEREVWSGKVLKI